MAKKENAITRFFGEFKTFITRGNVLDMSVGVIVGGAFTGIVNGLSNFLLKPFINWLLSLVLPGEGLSAIVTPLTPDAWITLEDGTKTLDLSLCLQWGELFSAIINFLLIAFVLFTIVKVINGLNDAKNKVEGEAATKRQLRKELRKIRKEEKVSKQEALAIYEARVQAAKAAKEAEEAAAAAAKAAEEKAAEEKAMANTVLLQAILAELKAK
jgi:large conductance mechanosensitive channel